MSRLSLLLQSLIIFCAILPPHPTVAITRADLLSGSEVPEKRPFPLSSKIPACQDFHAYVCNEVETTFKLPENRTHWVFSFTDAAERMLFAKKTYFKQLDKKHSSKTSPNNQRSQQLVNFYTSCMNPKAQAQDEKYWVQKQKKEILNLKSREDLIKFNNSRLDSDYFSFIGFDISANQGEPKNYDLILVSHLMNLPENSYYENQPLVLDFKKVVEKLFQEAGLDHPNERAQDVINFETEFAKVYPKPAEMRNRYSSNTYWPQEKWLKAYPHIDLNIYFKKLNGTTAIRNLAPESMQYVELALNEGPVEQLKNVMLYNSLKSIMDESYPAYFQEAFNFKKKHLGGPTVRPPRDERCTTSTMDTFPMELDQELIPILFPNFPDKEVITLAEQVRSAIVNGLKANSWLSESARKEGLEKITSAQLKLIKPQKDEDWNFLPIKNYSAQKIITNRFTAQNAAREKLWAEVKYPRYRNRWEMGPLGLNAYYSSEDNQFVLLQGILQYPFFDSSMSLLENTAAIGTIVGHELGHSVDDQGSKYDSQGKLRQWMATKDLSEFTRRGQAFIDRFNKIGHDGRLTLGENIGDHVGMTFSLDAAFPDLKKAAPEDLQKFFVAYARMWCHVERPDFQKLLLKVDPHASGTARINQQVIHQDAFYKAFQCRPTDAMYVENKDRIRIW